MKKILNLILGYIVIYLLISVGLNIYSLLIVCAVTNVFFIVLQEKNFTNGHFILYGYYALNIYSLSDALVTLNYEGAIHVASMNTISMLFLLGYFLKEGKLSIENYKFISINSFDLLLLLILIIK